MNLNSLAISVIMPAYNAEKYIKEAIESILNQTFKDFEFIIVDDASTDNTRKIIGTYAKKDGRIKVLYNEKNLGIVHSYNKAIKIAKGKYIAILENDDIAAPTRLEKQFVFMEANPKVGVCGTNIVLINEKGKEIGRRIRPELDKECRRAFFLYCPIFHTTAMIRKECFEKLGYYDDKFIYAQDLEIFMRFSIGYKLHNLQEFLGYYRLHAANASFKRWARAIKSAQMARLTAVREYHYSFPLLGYPAILFTCFFHIMPSKLAYKVTGLLRKIFLKKER